MYLIKYIDKIEIMPDFLHFCCTSMISCTFIVLYFLYFSVQYSIVKYNK